MDDNALNKLRMLQDMAVEHAVEEMDAASKLTLSSKTERGDRAWLTGMCSKSLGVAVRVEQFIALRERGAAYRGDTQSEEDEEKSQAAFIRRAEAQLKGIMERAKPRFKHGA